MIVFFSYLFFALFGYCSCESNYTYKFYPMIHLGPMISPESKMGWMNDPNGFCFFKGEYHLFYQYNPKSSLEPGIAHWGHAKSKDLINWEHLPIALYPDTSYDIDGVFSGSALVENDVMYLYYTGNNNHPGQTPDHEQHQMLAYSADGMTFTKIKEPVIIGADLQPNFRDPKVWKHRDMYYMVLGNSFNNNTHGRVLLFASKDKLNWEEVSVLEESDGSLGYMWECPDFFELDGHFVLLFSPQGVKPQGDKYNNLYACGYMIGHFDYESKKFTVTRPFEELDHGHDIYATQTMLNENGERILVAWQDMWETNYPEGRDGFTGQITLARVLTIGRDGRLIQHPVKAIEKAVDRELYAGSAREGTEVKIENKATKIEIWSSKEEDITLVIESEDGNNVTLSYNHENGRLTLNRGGTDGERSTQYIPEDDEKFHLVVYYDLSSIEAFFWNGKVTFSSRTFLTGQLTIRLVGNCEVDMRIHGMIRTVPKPGYELNTDKSNFGIFDVMRLLLR